MNAHSDVAAAPPGHGTGGRLVYAIGDIHGRIDILAPMLAHIAEDVEESAHAFSGLPLVVFLGDYIDRGSRSREVIDAVIAFAADPRFETRCLLGNHEEAMLDFLDRKTSGNGWSRRGGRQAMASYGVATPPEGASREQWSRCRRAFADAVPDAHIAFLRGLELTVEIGDLLFVHAGVRPGVPLDAQDRTDMLWIRSEFLGHDHHVGKLVVHGHTPAEVAYVGTHRVGLDTGAYASGLLSAARFDGSPPALIEIRAGGRG